MPGVWLPAALFWIKCGECKLLPRRISSMSTFIACAAKWTTMLPFHSSIQSAAWDTFSNMRKFLQPTAAWRISIWTAVAFAIGTALAFSIVYFLVAKAIQERSDAWLSGEAEVLARVSADTPKDHLYNRIVREVAELATQELPDERNARGQRLNSVFFLEIDPDNNENPLWVGPGSNDAFLKAIQRTKFVPGIPPAITVEGGPPPS